MNLLKHILVTFTVAIVTIFAVYGGYSIYAADGATDYQDFYKFQKVSSSGTFPLLSSEYHDAMNKFFNYKFEQLADLVDNTKDFTVEEKFKTVEISKEKKSQIVSQCSSDANTNCVADKEYAEIIEKCKENVSTYCVSMGALDIYIEYLKKLNDFKGSVPTVTASSPSIKNILGELNVRGSQVDKEAKDAKKVMEATINTYDEFRTAYPIHKQYLSIITNLVKYKLAFKKLATQTAEFPIKFVDSVSQTCK